MVGNPSKYFSQTRPAVRRDLTTGPKNSTMEVIDGTPKFAVPSVKKKTRFTNLMDRFSRSCEGNDTAMFDVC